VLTSISHYLITTQRSKRLGHALNELGKINIFPELIVNPIETEHHQFYATPGAYGCAKAHIQALKQFIQSNSVYACIYEDDIVVKRSFNVVGNDLYYPYRSDHPFDDKTNGPQLYSHAYVISKAKAKEVVNFYENPKPIQCFGGLSLHIDSVLRELSKSWDVRRDTFNSIVQGSDNISLTGLAKPAKSLTIIIPYYNKASTIYPTLRTVATAIQTANDLLINPVSIKTYVIDDGSTAEIPEETKQEFNQFTFLRNEVNVGQHILRLAKFPGDYFAYIDSDDYVDERWYYNALRHINVYRAPVIRGVIKSSINKEILERFNKISYSNHVIRRDVKELITPCQTNLTYSEHFEDVIFGAQLNVFKIMEIPYTSFVYNHEASPKYKQNSNYFDKMPVIRGDLIRHIEYNATLAEQLLRHQIDRT
jgi:hypothetical protein